GQIFYDLTRNHSSAHRLVSLPIAVASGKALLAADVFAVGTKVVLGLFAPALRGVGLFRVVVWIADGPAQIHRLVAKEYAGRRGDGGKRWIFFAECHSKT